MIETNKAIYKSLLERLGSLREIELQRKVIEPLLQANDFRNVRDVSGPNEKGRDIIAYKNELGCNILYVIQVKKLKISGRTSDSVSISALIRQLEEAIAEPVYDIVTKAMRQPERLMFITPFSIKRSTLDAAIARISKLAGMQITIVDGYMLVDQTIAKIPNVAISLNDDLAYQLSVIEKHKNIDESTAFGLDRPLDIRNIYVNADYDCFDRFSEVIKKFAITNKSIFNSNLEDWASMSHSKSTHTNVSMEVFQTHKTRWLKIPNENNTLFNIEAYCTVLVEYSIVLTEKIGILNQKGCTPNNVSSIISEVLEFQTVIKAIKYLTNVDERLSTTLTLQSKIETLESKVKNREGAISGEFIHHVNSSMLVTGGPGAGKTTLLRMLTLNYVSTDSDQRPIFIRAVDIKGSFVVSDILKLAYETANERDYRINNQQFISGLEDGEFKLIIDGVDETADNAKNVIISILELNKQYPKTTIIASCRETINWPDWPLSIQIRLNPFTDKQLNLFIDNWFNSEPESAKGIKHWLIKSPKMNESAQVPLNAALLCSLYGADADLPTTETELFNGRLELLLGGWEQAKNIPGIPVRYRRRYISFLMTSAYEIQKAESRTINFPELIKIAVRYHLSGYNSSVDSMIRDCQNRGILFCEPDGSLGFGHFAFQEFLVGKYLFHFNDIDELKKIIPNPWWKNSLLFYASLMNDLEPLLKKLSNEFIIENKGTLEIMCRYAVDTSLNCNPFVKQPSFKIK